MPLRSNLSWAVLCLMLCTSLNLSAKEAVTSTLVDFYSEKLKVSYYSSMVFKTRICAKNSCVKDYYEDMEETNYKDLLNDLMDHKHQLQLNDWLYYQLVENTVKKIWKSKDKMQQTLTIWFFLSKSGYETRISNAALEVVFIHVLVNDKVKGIPMHKEGSNFFMNITAFADKIRTNGNWLTQIKFVAPSKGQDMDLTLNGFPKLKPNIVKKTLTFNYMDQKKQIVVETDKNISDILNAYPRLDDETYYEIPISNTIKQSLFPQLEALMKGKTQNEKVAILTSFCRSAFEYKWDYDVYDDDVPLSAVQVFNKKYSDHEDRTALLYQLIKELLDLPMMVINYYEQYTTLAVELDEPIGDNITYKNRNYTVCDPTVPANSSKIGKWPNGLTKKTAEVVKLYK